MLIDIIFIALLALALFKGFTRGFIVALFSVLALVVGLAAAMKLSAVAAGLLRDSLNVSARWLTFLAFLIVFLLAVFLVRLGAAVIEKMVEMMMLGWLNRLAGILLYSMLYTVILSVILFYLEKIHLLTAETLKQSKTYAFIKPWGPAAIDGIGLIFPFFKNMFLELENFFESIKG
jgi:membrane protein required for colicin V production